MKIPRNPYLNRAMIRRPNDFFGRHWELARLTTRIAADPPQSVQVVGDRRIGKSSLVYHISHPEVAAHCLEDSERTVFLFMDFQEERRLSVKGFFDSLFRRLERALEGRYEIDLSPDYEGFRDVMDGLDREGIKLILLLDEFDRVTRSANFDSTFYGNLRALAGRHNLAYVISSSRDLEQLCHTQEIADSPFFNILTTLRLGPFAREEAVALIREPSRETPFSLEEYTDSILDLAGCLPLFLQIACSACFEILLEYGECVEEEVRTRFLEEAQPHFQYYWEHFNAVGRAICNDLACGRDADRNAPEYGDLVKRGFVRREGLLFSDLFAEFVRAAYAEEMGEEPIAVQAERMRDMERELDAAREIQMGLLPKEKPKTQGLDIEGRCLPASYVGGDFFTYLWLDADRTKLGIVAVDVMGKGMEAAVTAMRFSETLRYEARGRTGAAEILDGLNRALYGTLPPRAYVACCITVIDLARLEADVSVGGYYPPLHYCRGENRIVELDLGNLPLGIKRDTVYSSLTVELGLGDLLLFYSDGIVEAQDDREALYGEDRLRDVLGAAAREGFDAGGTIERVLWEVGRFSASTEQTDDRTVIAACVAK